MDEKPRRRLFRFRLSTVLILTAIVAWGMATGLPYERHGLMGTHHMQPFTSYWWEFNPLGLLPCFALAAFLGWKATWEVVDRRRGRSVGQR